MNISDVLFAKSGDLHIAYQRYGSGPDVIIIPGLVSNVELGWEEETYRRAREHNGRYVRALEFDKRGIASSDRFERHPTLEERIGDIVAVMDAEGIGQASVLGLSEGGLMGQMFAALHPERVDRLILVNSAPGPSCFQELEAAGAIDDPERTAGAIVAKLTGMIEAWGRTPELMVNLMNPSQRDNPAFVRWTARFQRQTASPSDIKRQLESVLLLDAAEQLGRIKAPTLVMNVTGDRLFHPATGRWLADRIPGATFREFAGDDHFCWVMPSWRSIQDCWIEFVTGTTPPAHSARRFATVLFTDIVDSTTRCAELGNEAWRSVLEQHDRIAWSAIDRHHGRIVKNTGDGVLATFDTPSAAVAFASEFRQALDGVGIAIRAGAHAGEIEVREDGDVVGLAVSLAARVEEAADPGTIYVSSTVRDLLLGSTPSFEDRGDHALKGVDGTWRLYEIAS